MSKASLWALANQATDSINLASPRGIRMNHPEQEGRVMVERDGKLFLELRHIGIATVGGSIQPGDALALAHWILDTFGEAQP